MRHKTQLIERAFHCQLNSVPKINFYDQLINEMNQFPINVSELMIFDNNLLADIRSGRFIASFDVRSGGPGRRAVRWRHRRRWRHQRRGRRAARRYGDVGQQVAAGGAAAFAEAREKLPHQVILRLVHFRFVLALLRQFLFAFHVRHFAEDQLQQTNGNAAVIGVQSIAIRLKSSARHQL